MNSKINLELTDMAVSTIINSLTESLSLAEYTAQANQERYYAAAKERDEAVKNMQELKEKLDELMKKEEDF